MSRLLGRIGCESTSTESRIRFETTGGGQWQKWDRFLLLDGKPAYHLGNICNTCAFFFKRLDGANGSLTFDELEEVLSNWRSSPVAAPCFGDCKCSPGWAV